METITLQQYAQAVVASLKIAQQPTSGGRVAAQALLSAYNGYDYQLDVSDLCNLDRKNYESVLTVIRGRYDTGQEPHNLIVDGDKIFAELWKKWQRLHVRERGKVDCPSCRGCGRKYESYDDEEGVECSCCEGLGRVCRCKAE